MRAADEGIAMPLFAVLIYASDAALAESGPGTTPENDRHAEELAESGALVLAYALTPRDRAVSIRADGVSAGPFLGDAPVIAGYYLLDAPDLDAAVRIASGNPAIAEGGGVEVRPVHAGGVVRAE